MFDYFPANFTKPCFPFPHYQPETWNTQGDITLFRLTSSFIQKFWVTSFHLNPASHVGLRLVTFYPFHKPATLSHWCLPSRHSSSSDLWTQQIFFCFTIFVNCYRHLFIFETYNAPQHFWPLIIFMHSFAQGFATHLAVYAQQTESLCNYCIAFSLVFFSFVI